MDGLDGLAEASNLFNPASFNVAGEFANFNPAALGGFNPAELGSLGRVGGLNLNPSEVPSLAASFGAGIPTGAPATEFMPGGGGVLETISKYAKPVSAILGGLGAAAQIPLGLAGLNVARQGQKAQAEGIRTAEAAAAPQIAAEQALLPAGTHALMTGELPPELQQQVNNQVNQTKQALLQQLTNAGIDPATAESMIAGQLEQMRNQLTMQAAQALLSGGGGVGGGGSTAVQAGQLGGQEMNTANQALQSANQSMMRLLSGGG